MSSWHPQAAPRAMKKGFPHHIARKGSAVLLQVQRRQMASFLTNGGRVLSVTELRTPCEAIAKSYEAVKTVKFDNAFYRNDIGKKALASGEV